MLRRTFPGYTFLVSLAVASIYTNIPQEKGINTACRAYENFNRQNTPIPTQTLKEILGLILQKNSFVSTTHTEQAEQLRANKDSSHFREYLQLSSVETEVLILVEKILTIISHCETVKNWLRRGKKWISLPLQTGITTQLNSRLKYQMENVLDTTIHEGGRFNNQGVTETF